MRSRSNPAYKNGHSKKTPHNSVLSMGSTAVEKSGPEAKTGRTKRVFVLDSSNPHPVIAPEEIITVGKELRRLKFPERYHIETGDRTVTIYEADKITYPSSTPMFDFLRNFLDNTVGISALDSAVLRFIIVNEVSRHFIVERFCFRSSMEGWIYLHGPAALNHLVKNYVPHLGKSSFYRLHN